MFFASTSQVLNFPLLQIDQSTFQVTFENESRWWELSCNIEFACIRSISRFGVWRKGKEPSNSRVSCLHKRLTDGFEGSSSTSCKYHTIHQPLVRASKLYFAVRNAANSSVKLSLSIRTRSLRCNLQTKLAVPAKNVKPHRFSARKILLDSRFEIRLIRWNFNVIRNRCLSTITRTAACGLLNTI